MYLTNFIWGEVGGRKEKKKMKFSIVEIFREIEF